jgi:ribosomal protein L11 methyltransferase
VLAQLLDLFPQGVEELDDGFAVYVDEAGAHTLHERFDVRSEDDVVEGWEDNWRGFHHGVVVGRFWIGPPWEAPPAGVESVVIDPGRAFGTGAHPTTRLTLALLQEQPPTSLLDVGCGSGVLSIAAAKLGFAPLVAVDVDPDAIEVTDENAGANGVEIDARVCDALTDELPAVQLVVANVALDVVEALLARAPARRVITSGYLERDEPRVAGWQTLERRTDSGWAADLVERA